MEQYSDLLWREVSPGRYERNIDEPEQFYTSMAKTYEATGHTYFAITAYTGISVSRSSTSEDSGIDARVEKALRWAWKKLRHDHPTLAAPVEYDHETKRCKKMYKTLRDKQEVDTWMSETFKVVDHVQTGEAFANTDPPVGSYATLYIVTPPTCSQSEKNFLRRDIIFRSHHDLVDGVGTLMLLNNFLQHASTAFGAVTELPIEFGAEYRNLSPPLRVAAGIPQSPNADQKSKLAKLHSINEASRTGSEVLSLPFSSTVQTPGNSQRTAIHFSLGESSSILAKTKTFRSTVTQVFHAAIALAVRDLQPKTSQVRPGRYFSYSLVNLRHCCIPPYHKPRHAASVYHCVSANHLVVDLTVPAESTISAEQAPEEFLTTLEQVRNFYHNATIDADYLSIVPSLFTAVTPEYPTSVSNIPAPNQSPSVSLSSLGIVDRIAQPEHGAFEVMEPWVMGAEYSTGIGAFLSTWNGILCLSAGYNEAFHSKAEVVDFLERVQRIVLEGLEIYGLGLGDGNQLPLRTG
ncbi:hypothetical protein ONS95_003387 [Cadophora gregata]|uniref:uncharacterized protein n=1 Tax=Cadophora gregata TaxID=51156 RepID=UPI0026DB3820|nr:uncharacterized protein ONS95_003387 [Cadophora gregata]KAK0108590.1 hypothetical protein ONS95_003387 [Cadophora gregata]KAK0108817.1 hypothetical protein ONS96_002659 [Cadophora gregata f. sp. sojae]